MKFTEDDVSFFQRQKYDSLFLMATPHTHEHNELYFLVNGQTTYFVETSIYLLNAGDFIFIPKGKFHQTDNSRFPRLERILINFDDAFAGDEFIPYIEEFKVNPHIRLPEEQLQKFYKLMQKIERESDCQDKNAQELQRLYFRELLLLLSRHRLTDIPNELSDIQRTVQDAIRYISINYKQPLDLCTLAQKYSLSQGYFSKIFKKYTGMRVRKYINITRVLAAREMLSTTSLPITDVAFECGFNDSNYFSQVFKQITGTTPKKISKASK